MSAGAKIQKAGKALAFVLIVIVIIVTVYTILCYLSDLRAGRIDPNAADIVIVGSGPAGCVAARRLHDEFPHLKIVLLERGADRHADPKVYNVAKALDIAYSAPYSEVLPDSASSDVGLEELANLKDLGVVPSLSTASMLGGCSSHNLSLTVHGTPNFYNGEWKKQLGIGYDKLSRHFHHIEEFSGISEDNNEHSSNRTRGQHGLIPIGQLPISVDKLTKIGPALRRAYGRHGAVEGTRILERTLHVAMHAGTLRAPDNISNAILQAIEETRPHVKIVDDYNLSYEACASKRPQIFVDETLGIRSSADVCYLGRTYLEDQNRNLQIGQNKIVTSLDIINTNPTEHNLNVPIRCNGVNWTDQDGKRGSTKLKKGGRVILAAGALYSPLILLKSGLGSTNKEIGQNMMNHYGCTLIFQTRQNFNFSSGPVTFIPRHSEGASRDWQMIVGSGMLVDPHLLTRVGLTPKDGFFSNMISWIMDPKVRGAVRQSSSKDSKLPKETPWEQPITELNMYTDGDVHDEDSDIRSIVESLRWMYSVVCNMRQDELFCNDGDLQIVFPPEDVLERDDLDELSDWAKIGLSQTDHYSGTCSLGKVVDPKDFTVYGTTNIHVVDASTFPSIPDGNTEFPVLLMGEEAVSRIAKIIK